MGTSYHSCNNALRTPNLSTFTYIELHMMFLFGAAMQSPLMMLHMHDFSHQLHLWVSSSSSIHEYNMVSFRGRLFLFVALTMKCRHACMHYITTLVLMSCETTKGDS